MEIVLSKENFETEALKSDIPVIVDFWASWCGPCKMLAPVIAQIAEEYAGRIKVGKVNVDDEPELANSFRVSSIPTVVLIRNGAVAATSIGLKPKEKLLADLGI